MAQVTMKAMLDAGVHFGHQTQRWNPKMKPYVFTDRGGIHIIDLHQTVDFARKAAEFVKKTASEGGRLIFVGTKKQAVEPIQEAAASCGQFYVTKRWLGGMLTNFATIKASIDRLKKIDLMREQGELEFFSKKERAGIEKEYTRLLDYLDGIRDMRGMPTAMFVVDLNMEHIAVAEAKRLGIKVIGIADTNVNPEMADFPIPGNDDAIRSIKLFAGLIADSYNEGAKEFQATLRTQVDKGDEPVIAPRGAKDEAPRRRGAARPEPAIEVEDKKAGPAIVKASKTRKLVAAGTADDVEIQQELEEGEKPAETPEETPDESAQ